MYTSSKSSEMDRVQDFCNGAKLSINARGLAPTPQKGKRYLVILNPFSGNGSGTWAYCNVILPMFTACGAKLNLIETRSSSHITELGKDMARAIAEEGEAEEGESEEAPQKNILICGGDGSFQEYVNGVVEHLTRGTFEIDDSVRKAFRRMNLIPIPCGSCNGLSISLGARTVYDACVAILSSKGPESLDLWKVEYFDRSKRRVKCNLDVHVISTGLVAEVDYLQENTFRCLGTRLKSLLVPLYVMARKETFKASIFFKPHESHLNFTEEHKSRFYRDPNKLQDIEIDGEVWKSPSVTSTEGDTFAYIISSNAPWAASDAMIHPDVRLDDCSGTLVIVRGTVSRMDLLQSFLMMDKGTHVSFDFVHFYRISAFRLDFHEENGLVSSSGDVTYCHTIKSTVYPLLASLLYGQPKSQPAEVV